MEDVVRRIHKTGRITSTADYQIGKMAQQGKSTEWIESEIKRLGNLTDAEVRSLYDKVVQADYVRKRGLYEQVNANYTPYEDNKVMQKWVHALIDQTQGELKNISRSMGFSVPTGNGKTAFTPLADYYQRYIDRACMDIMTGAFDYNTVLRRVAKENGGFWPGIRLLCVRPRRSGNRSGAQSRHDRCESAVRPDQYAPGG